MPVDLGQEQSHGLDLTLLGGTTTIGGACLGRTAQDREAGPAATAAALADTTIMAHRT